MAFGFGAGNNLLGGSGPEIAASLQSRRMGDGVSPLSQVSMGVPSGGAVTSTMPLPPSQMPASPMPVGQMTSQAPKSPRSESEMIVSALIQRLKALGQTIGPSQM